MQLEKIYKIAESSEHVILNEEEGYDKYGQKRYVRYVISLIVLTVSASIATIILISINKDAQLYILNAFTLIVSSLQLSIIFYHSFTVTNWLYEDLSITLELFIVLIVYFVFECIYHGIAIYFDNEPKRFVDAKLVIGVLLILRNALWIIVSFVIPFLKNKEEYLIKFKETKECANNLEMTLSSRVGYLCFSSYVENKFDEGKTMMQLFSLLMIRKEKEKEGFDASQTSEEIRNVLNASSISEIPVNQPMNLIYDNAIDVVMKKLNDYYEKFKSSHYWRELKKELYKREIINDRLQLADLI